MKNLIFKSVIFIITLDIVIASAAIYRYMTQDKWVVNTKYTIFSNFTNDKLLFSSSPNVIYGQGFTTDSVASNNKWLNELDSNLPGFSRARVSYQNNSEFEKARNIVLDFIKNGSDYCSDKNNLFELLLYLNKGNHGCCTDHSQGFLAYSFLFDLDAREVHTVGHVTAEFYDHTLNKWLWIDPLYAMMARSKEGEYLSLLEIREKYYLNLEVDYEFFGKDTEYFNKVDPYLFTYYDDKEDFETIMITWGNNVFEEDYYNTGLSNFPKSLRQYIGILTGKIPFYYKLIDEQSTDSIDDLNSSKFIYLIVINVFVIINAALIILFFLAAVSKFFKRNN